MQRKLCLLPEETELENQDLKGVEFVEACTRRKNASQRRITRTLQTVLSIFNKDYDAQDESKQGVTENSYWG